MDGRALALAALALAVASRARAAVVPVPAASSGATPEPPRWPTPASGREWEPYFSDADARSGLPRGMTSRVAWQESRYNPDAISSAGASGIMGIVPRWHPGVDVWDPVASIYYGAGYLRANYDRFAGSWRLALAAYNAGPGAVAQYGGIPPYAETQQYVRSIAADLGL